MLAMGLAFLIFGTATRPILLAPAMVFLGCGTAVVFSALSIVISELVPHAVLGRATAISSSVTFLGQFVSPIVLGPIMASTSITAGHLMLAGAAALIFLILAIAGRQSQPVLAPAELCVGSGLVDRRPASFSFFSRLARMFDAMPSSE